MEYFEYLLRASVEALREVGEEDDDGYDAYISLAIEIEEFLASEDNNGTERTETDHS